ncbi:NAD(+) diphosphatase [Ponticoccus sp. SC2-23]|uniref:NAD(+) diphosphatase n=1 Tax=Alexandriicola marinus TaxID=2081710 RepID=UPI000FDAC8DB|nr:NAD(+) diphosphatase [Alexandriicola marinus]MBM1220260.1 NAD(+) diphosphatase [Ponticoccus sp. SC6-9]MBM1224946.1 NAD(+) diphosphatase [Ponticoccus sp. SC6-15]MBM1228460.1 NAD(+) diphosphatase [Ponticoccus sp. SC6-38]MBM1233903.1 NAD(+) diphosphatase [Ponticoccus sp. SC6-45]MBM1238961.1 NAD(+) diphosphatase [Ponticoccus sp. SC6-49]MBM1242743.1 NAD(+) diphosphatase [Ponticoccus sp. SC2-64]MBM1247427.1 NAD(+) diphosphatase [Ponticoccus sp. SC6-42]MBM1251914.1 NAD(+) diphosphatase [Pontico
MKIAETVTFGGSALDRRADLRSRPDTLASLMLQDDAGIVPFWRGKPLVTRAGDDIALGWLKPGHEALEDAVEPPVFLGLDEGRPVWAADISRWNPEDVDLSTLGLFLDPSEQHHPDIGDDMWFAELRAVMIRLDPRNAELAASAKAVLGWHQTHGFCSRCGSRSRIEMAGWQRVCPDCGGHHFPRTDPVVIMLILNGNDVLLGRSPGWPEGMYSLLAGFVEPGESLEAAVRREVFEETAVKVGSVSYLASQPWPFPASLMFGCMGHATSREIEVDPEEIEHALWVSRERLAAAFRNEDDTIKPARPGAIARFLLENWLADRLD